MSEHPPSRKGCNWKQTTNITIFLANWHIIYVLTTQGEDDEAGAQDPARNPQNLEASANITNNTESSTTGEYGESDIFRERT